MDNWQPESPQEQDLKDAIARLQTSIGAVVTNVDNPGATKVFVLNAQCFFDFRSYVMSCKDFPKSDNEFRTKFPEEIWRGITIVDDKIYEMTMRTIVELGRSCSDFYSEQLSRLVNAAFPAMAFADNSSNLLTQDRDLSLKHNLCMMLDKQNRDALMASESARLVLGMLKEEADQKRGDLEGLIESLVRFKSTTARLLPQVQHLAMQFKTGAVSNSDSSQKAPYLEQLDSELSAKIDEVSKQVIQAQCQSTEWASKPDQTIGSAFWPGLGWMAMSMTASETTMMKQAYQGLESTTHASMREDQRTAQLVQIILTMIQQCAAIDAKIRTVLEAFMKLKNLFSDSEDSYNRISDHLNAMNGGAKFSAGCRDSVNEGLEEVSRRLKELQASARVYQKDIVREIKLW